MKTPPPKGYTEEEWATRCPFCFTRPYQKCRSNVIARRNTWLSRPHKARTEKKAL